MPNPHGHIYHLENTLTVYRKELDRLKTVSKRQAGKLHKVQGQLRQAAAEKAKLTQQLRTLETLLEEPKRLKTQRDRAESKLAQVELEVKQLRVLLASYGTRTRGLIEDR